MRRDERWLDKEMSESKDDYARDLREERRRQWEESVNPWAKRGETQDNENRGYKKEDNREERGKMTC